MASDVILEGELAWAGSAWDGLSSDTRAAILAIVKAGEGWLTVRSEPRAPASGDGVSLLPGVMVGPRCLAMDTAEFARRYCKWGGTIKVIVKKGGKHQPHSLKDPTPIVDFILASQ